MLEFERIHLYVCDASVNAVDENVYLPCLHVSNEISSTQITVDCSGPRILDTLDDVPAPPFRDSKNA